MSGNDVQVAYGAPPVPPEDWDKACNCGGDIILGKPHKEGCPHFKGHEAVDHPTHYGGEDNPYEAIKVIEAWKLGFNLGNSVKYISRHEHKGTALEDLKKARWYLEREIQKMEQADE
jgi:hypothetical protein